MSYKHLFNILLALFLLISGLGYGATGKGNNDSLAAQKILKQADSIRLKQQQPKAPSAKIASPLVFPKVTGFGSFVSGRPKNHAVFGDYIYIKIDSMPALLALTDSIAGKNNDTLSDIILYINGNAMRDLKVLSIDQQEHKLMFQLDRHSPDLMKFYPRFQTMWSTIQVSISAGYKNGMILKTHPVIMELSLEYVSMRSMLFTLLLLVCIVGGFFVLASTTNLIRIGNDDSPFSLALTQLSFWSIVVASSFVYIWIVTDETPPITGSTLILLSVSALTTAGSKLVDIRAKTDAGTHVLSVSFMQDILKDDLGYSVHRAQMFMWTVILGIVFLSNVIRLQQIPQLDESLLALMGISSGAYVGLKTMENKGDTKVESPEDKNKEN